MSQRSRGEGFKKVTATQTGTNAGATATLAATTGAKNIVTHIAVSGDAACVVTIEIPSGTVVWQKRFTAAFDRSENFAYGEFEGGYGQDVNVKISASTSHCEANIAGLQAAQ